MASGDCTIIRDQSDITSCTRISLKERSAKIVNHRLSSFTMDRGLAAQFVANHRLTSFTMDRGLAAQFVAPVPGPCK